MNGKGRVLTADLEAVGLLPDIRPGHREDLHILRLKDYYSGETFSFFDDFNDRVDPVWLDEYEEDEKAGDMAEGIRCIETCDVLIWQNVVGYDQLAIEKAMGVKIKRNHMQRINHELFPFKTADTMVMSQVLNPERRAPWAALHLGLGNVPPHSIAAHGIRIDRHKPHHEDWSHLSIDMIHRVAEDVEIGEDFFNFLMKEWDDHLDRPHNITGKDIRSAYENEFRVAQSVAYQAERGFAIDVEFMGSLIEELDIEIKATRDAFMPHMPQRIKMKKYSEAAIEKNAAAIAELLSMPAGEYENHMLNGDMRAGYASTIWAITKKNGEYGKNVTKHVPAARGFMQDHTVDLEVADHLGVKHIVAYPKPPVAGPFTPLVWEDIPLGNRDEVKQILYKYGWIGVNFNDAETDYIEENDGDLPKPWAGKIDDKSLERWEESESTVPDWCKGIARWYILSARRTQLLNRKDVDYFSLNKRWPRQASKNNECRGLLPKSRLWGAGATHGSITAQEYYELNGVWPTSGHWRVPAHAFACATNTHRMRHKIVVNIPARGLYGTQMRRCFIAGPGMMLLGCDGAGLELRMLAHFMNDPEYTDIILNGDIHTYNQEKAGLTSRDIAKVFVYSFLYGSGIKNLARQLGLKMQDMADAVELFKEQLPKLATLIEGVQAAGKKFGYMLAVDGRRGRIRSKGKTLSIHTALNVLLQMTGSLVMKHAHVRAEDMAVEQGLIERAADFRMVAHQHDEAQMEVPESEVLSYEYHIKPTKEAWKLDEKREHRDSEGRMWSAPTVIEKREDAWIIQRRYHPLGQLYCDSITWAGEELRLLCPTAGEYKIGLSWTETH